MKMVFTYNLYPISQTAEETLLRFCGIIAYLKVYFNVGDYLLSTGGGYVEFLDEEGVRRILLTPSKVTFYDMESFSVHKYLDGIKHEIYKISKDSNNEGENDEY